MKKIVSKVLIVCMLVFALTSQLSIAAVDTKVIQILATSDLHNRMVAYDYATNSAISKGGFSRVATKIKEQRLANPNTVLIDNGDTIQGNSSMLFLKDPVLPMVMGLNALNYDVFVSGNHEFNYGMTLFKQVRDTFNGTFLSANVYQGEAVPANRVADNYDIITRDGVNIAVIGAVTPHITKWDKTNLEGYTVTNPYDEIRQAIDEIKAGNLGDVIVVSFHAGFDGEFGNDSATYVANNFPEVDAVIAGHAHQTRLERSTTGALVIEPGSFGSSLAQINITLTLDTTTGKYVVADRAQDVVGQNIAVDKTVAEDAEITALLGPAHQRAVADANQIIGSLSGGNLIQPNEIADIPQAQLEDSAFIDLILKVQMMEAEKALGATIASSRQVSGAALFNTNTNVLEGQMTKADVSKIYQFDNTLVVLKVNGLQLKKYMEWSAGYYNTFNPGDLTVSFNANIPAYNYDMFAGVDYQVDISKPEGSRVVNLVYSSDKQVVQDTDTIFLTINNYRANGLMTDLPEFATAEKVYESTGSQVDAIRDMITNYIIEKQTITPDVDHNWQLTGYSYDPSLRAIVVKLIGNGTLLIPRSEDGRKVNGRSVTLADVAQVTKTVDLLSFNDFHGSILESGKNIGASKLAAYLLDAKAQNPNTILLSGGDHYQGSALSNLTKGEVLTDIFKEIGIQYSAVGNHEFDWGVNLLPTWQTQGGYQFLAANIVNNKTGQPADFVKPYAIVDVNGTKIGIIGIATPDTKYSTLPANVADLDFLDPASTVEKYEPIVRAEGAQAVIVLSHLASFQTDGVVSGDGATLANALSKTAVNGIITAHSHQFVSGYVNGIPVVQAGYNGRGVAKIHTVFDLDGQYIGSWQEVDNLSSRVSELGTSPAVDTIINQYMKDLEPVINEVIGTSDAFDHTTSNEVQVTPMGYQVAKMMKEAGKTDVAIINGGGIRKGFDEGNITVGEMYEIFPFDNTLVTVDVTGAQLKELILHGMFTQGFKPGQFYGLTVYYGMTADNLPEITSMRLLDGTKVEDTKVYSVSILDFMLTGGDKYDFSQATHVNNTQLPLRDLLTQMIKEQKHLTNAYKNPLIQGTDQTIDPDNNKKVLPETGMTSSIGLSGLIIVGGLYMVVSNKRRQDNA